MSVAYTEGTTVGDWLKARPLDPAYDSETVEIKSGDNLVSGTVLGKITATGYYTKCNTAASDGSQTALGILLQPVNATGVYATGATGTPATNGIDWEAVNLGTQGNDVTVDLVDPAANDATIDVVVSGDIQVGYTVEVDLATDGTGGITSTPALVIAAVAADADAAALVAGTADGTGYVVDETEVLTGGTDYVNTNQGVMLSNLTGCVVYLSNLTYSGSAATIQAALEGLGAVVALETD